MSCCFKKFSTRRNSVGFGDSTDHLSPHTCKWHNKVTIYKHVRTNKKTVKPSVERFSTNCTVIILSDFSKYWNSEYLMY